MNCKFIKILLFALLLSGCELSTGKKSKKLNINFEKKYQNIGFALIYDDKMKDLKKLENRSLTIFHKLLKKKLR